MEKILTYHPVLFNRMSLLSCKTAASTTELYLQVLILFI